MLNSKHPRSGKGAGVCFSMVEADQHGGNGGQHSNTSATGGAHSQAAATVVCIPRYIQQQPASRANIAVSAPTAKIFFSIQNSSPPHHIDTPGILPGLRGSMGLAPLSFGAFRSIAAK